MRYIAVIAAVCIFSAVCYCQTSPNVPGLNTAATAKPLTANTPITAPPPQVQSPITTDEAIRIARTELERDMYKHAAETTQGAVDHTKWIFTSMLTAFGILLAIFGYMAYKETKKYEEATAKAEQAAKDAKKWEQEAKAILANVDIQAKKTLDEIKKQGEKQIKELLAKAETEREISELWDEGLRANNKREYEKVRDKYAQIIRRKPDAYEVRVWWCAILASWAKRGKNDQLLKEARDVYDELKALAAEHKDKSEIKESQIAAGVSLAEVYSHSEKMPEAKALLDEIEPLIKNLSEGESRQALTNWISELRQKPGMK
jgi:hypothetical protein